MKPIYERMWHESAAKLRKGQDEVDRLIDDPSDSRRGLSLIIRPQPAVLESMASFIDRAKEIDNHQYFYSPPEIHTTVMSIVTCARGFELGQVRVSDYVELITECIEEIDDFNIRYSGVTASANCVMAQGFVSCTNLERLRATLRIRFAASGLQSSIDQRYPIETAHSTLVRFRKRLEEPDNFVSLLEEYRCIEFGRSKVTKLDLVFNDWYHRNQLVKLLHSFELRPLV